MSVTDPAAKNRPPSQSHGSNPTATPTAASAPSPAQNPSIQDSPSRGDGRHCRRVRTTFRPTLRSDRRSGDAGVSRGRVVVERVEVNRERAQAGQHNTSMPDAADTVVSRIVRMMRSATDTLRRSATSREAAKRTHDVVPDLRIDVLGASGLARLDQVRRYPPPTERRRRSCRPTKGTSGSTSSTDRCGSSWASSISASDRGKRRSSTRVCRTGSAAPSAGRRNCSPCSAPSGNGRTCHHTATDQGTGHGIEFAPPGRPIAVSGPACRPNRSDQCPIRRPAPIESNPSTSRMNPRRGWTSFAVDDRVSTGDLDWLPWIGGEHQVRRQPYSARQPDPGAPLKCFHFFVLHNHSYFARCAYR
jgi:hypothetical protein